MNDKRSISTGVILLVLIVIGAGAWYFTSSGVSSVSTTKSLKSPQTIKVGQEKIIEGLTISVKEVTEDSRCPKGVNCVWAGRVTAIVTLSADSQTKTGPINSNESVPFGDYQVTLIDATPTKTQNGNIKPGDYALTFTVEKKAAQASSTKTYSNDQYGFSFTYPSSYYLETHDESVSGRDHFAVVLTEDTKENQDVRTGVGPGRDGPESISFDVYKDPIGNPTLLQWLKDTPGSNFDAVNGKYETSTLAGKDAVSYHWSGLYEADTIAAQNKGYTFAATVTYLNKTDPIVQIYNDIIKTINFK